MGTKKDLRDKFAGTGATELGQDLAVKLSAEFFLEISSLEQTNVGAVFESMARAATACYPDSPSKKCVIS